MGKLIRFELSKVIRKKSTYFIFGVGLFVLILGLIRTQSLINREIPGYVVTGPILAISALNNTIFSKLLGIFVALYVVEDYSNNTFKNILSKGYTRFSVYMSKFIVCNIVSLFFAILFISISLVSGNMIGSSNAALTSDFYKNILLQLLLIVAYNSLFFFVSMGIGKVGFSVGFNLIGPSIIILVLELIFATLDIDTMNLNKLFIDYPFNRLSMGIVDDETIKSTLLIGLVYIITSTFIGLIISRKKEF